MTAYLNDLGIVCALGDNKADVMTKFITDDSSQMNIDESYGQRTVIGKVATALPNISDYPVNQQTRNNQLALVAFKQIEPLLENLKAKVPAQRIGVVVGTSTSGIASGEESMVQYIATGEHLTDYSYAKQEMGATAQFIADLAGAKGNVYGISTACTSGAKALVSGQRLLDSGFADIVIVGGVDSLCQMTINGFKSIESISSEHTRPFQAGRNGINIGEGAALFLMSKFDSGIVLKGFGETSDAHHISAPHPQGGGAISAMKKALVRAKLTPQDINYINLHGTGTVQNDAMEATAVNALFPSDTYCSASKALHGHCLGAAGAIEAGLCWLLLSDYNKENHFPKPSNTYNIDPVLTPINLAQQEPKQGQKINYCMSNSYAFGGNNASLILAKNHV